VPAHNPPFGYLTTAAMSNHSHGNPTLNLTNLSGTTASNSAGFTLSLSAGAGGPGGDAVAISAGDNSQITGTVNFSASNGITFGLSNDGVMTATVRTDYQSAGAYLTTAALSNHSHGNPTLALTNLNGTTASASNGFTLSLSAFATTAALSNHSHGNPALFLTNLSGTTASASNGFTLSLAAGAGGGIAIEGNGANGVGSFSTGTLDIHAGNNITISTGAQAISIHAPAPGGGAGFTKSKFFPWMEAEAILGQIGQGTLHFHPVPDPDNFCFDRVLFDVSISQATASNSSHSATLSMWAGLYTRNVSTLSLLVSSSTSQQIIKSGTVQNATWLGPRLFSMGWTTTITQADIWMGIVSRTTSAGGNMTLSQYVGSDIAQNFSGIVGVASNATQQNALGLGAYSATTSAMPASVAFSQINGTNSSVFRVPMYYFLSGTA
jgi:hypothetical protein